MRFEGNLPRWFLKKHQKKFGCCRPGSMLVRQHPRFSVALWRRLFTRASRCAYPWWLSQTAGSTMRNRLCGYWWCVLLVAAFLFLVVQIPVPTFHRDQLLVGANLYHPSVFHHHDLPGRAYCYEIGEIIRSKARYNIRDDLNDARLERV